MSEEKVFQMDFGKIYGLLLNKAVKKVEEIENPIMRDIRCLDKLIDELAKGRPMEKILRK